MSCSTQEEMGKIYFSGRINRTALSIKKDGKEKKHKVTPGAIIGDGDHKRAPFIVLGLAP